MTIRQIKRRSMQRLRDNGGNCFSMTIFTASVIALMLISFMAVRLIFIEVGWDQVFSFKKMTGDVYAIIFWSVMAVILLPLLAAEWWIIRRLFIDIVRGEDFVETKNYINAHSFMLSKKYIMVSADVFLRKVIFFFPAVAGGVGIYHIIVYSETEQLSSPKLLLLMLCIGFTGVWIGVFLRYIISISMTPYIMCLNPRAKVSQAIALSKRVMEGNHTKYIFFMLSFVKFLPLCFFVYPLFVIYPYFKIAHVTLAEDILGDYWQDKLAASTKRWRRYRL